MTALKRILLGFVLLVLFAPMVQQWGNFVDTFPLFGSFRLAADDTLSLDKWMAGTYQENKGKYINDNISFRPDFIRINSQIDFSFFNKVNSGWGVVGKENCMFDEEYIGAWAGNDFVGYDSIYSQMRKVKALQDTLAKLGKSLVVVHAASKGFYYEKYIPDDRISAVKKTTNYAVFVKAGDSLGINQIDMNRWFCAMRDTCKELLYPKQGIHWSYYGAMRASDSLTRYLAKLSNRALPRPAWINLRHTTDPIKTDYDIAKAMNLMRPVTTETFTYGDLYCSGDTVKKKPSALYLGDSFILTMRETGAFDCVNNDWEIWYYFRERFSNHNGESILPTDGYDWQSVINRSDYLVILYTAINLPKFGSGFVEAAYAHYYPGKR